MVILEDIFPYIKMLIDNYFLTPQGVYGRMVSQVVIISIVFLQTMELLNLLFLKSYFFGLALTIGILFRTFLSNLI